MGLWSSLSSSTVSSLVVVAITSFKHLSHLILSVVGEPTAALLWVYPNFHSYKHSGHCTYVMQPTIALYGQNTTPLNRIK
jgi:hypothetical protein